MNEPQQGSNKRAWIVCLTASLLFFFTFAQLNFLNSLHHALSQSFHLTAIQYGHLATGYFYTNVLLLFPAGILLDRYPVKRIICVSMFLMTIAALIFAFSTSYWQLFLSRLMVGAIGTFALLSCVRLAASWFQTKMLAYVIGIIVTIGMMGGMFAQYPVTVLVNWLGWREAIFSVSLLGFVFFVLMLVLIKEKPIQAKNEVIENHSSQGDFWTSLKQVAANKENWLGGLIAGLINLPIFIFGTSWSVPYLEQSHGLNAHQAALVTGMIFFGMIIGSPLVGKLSDAIQQRRLPMLCGALLLFALLLMLMFTPHLSFIDLQILFFFIGFLASSQIIAYPFIAESNPQRLIGTAEGLSCVLIMGGGFTVSLFPYLLNWHWSGLVVNHIPIYSHLNYFHALMMLPISMVLAAVATLFIRETNCQPFEMRREQLERGSEQSEKFERI